MGRVLDKSGTDEAESLVNVRCLQLKYARVLYESLLVLVLTYGSETMIRREEERSGIRAEPLTLMRCYSCEIPQPYEAMEG